MRTVVEKSEKLSKDVEMIASIFGVRVLKILEDKDCIPSNCCICGKDIGITVDDPIICSSCFKIICDLCAQAKVYADSLPPEKVKKPRRWRKRRIDPESPRQSGRKKRKRGMGTVNV